MKSRAKELFERIRSGGVSEIQRLIDDYEPESLFLDFKRASSDGDPKLDDSDNKNLGKGISGFGNSEGGVIIWGIDCHVDKATGKEVVSTFPLKRAKDFQNKLESAVSRTTTPVHSGVLMETVLEGAGSDRGYVVTYVPLSRVGPIRANHSNHYHVRAGSSFTIMQHSVLSGLFGQTPRPRICAQLLGYAARLDQSRTWFNLQFGIGIANVGVVPADRPYVAGQFGNFPSEHLQIQSATDKFIVSRSPPFPAFSALASSGTFLPPGDVQLACNIVVQIPVGHPRELRMELNVGSFGSAPHQFTLSAGQAQVAQAMSVVQNGGGTNLLDLIKLDPPFNEDDWD